MYSEYFRTLLLITYCLQIIRAQNNFTEKWFDNTITEYGRSVDANVNWSATKNSLLKHKIKESNKKSLPESTNEVYTELEGGVIASNAILYSEKSPYLFRKHVIIARGAKVIIEPGVRIAFPPRVGIHVQGILQAKVNILEVTPLPFIDLTKILAFCITMLCNDDTFLPVRAIL